MFPITRTVFFTSPFMSSVTSYRVPLAMFLANSIFLACILLVFLFWIFRRRKHSSSPRFLPGPKPKWLVGNLFDIPTQSPWLVFTEWRKQFDVFSLRALGNSIVVLNTMQSISELLEKRGNIYSDRPRLIMGGELMGLDRTTGMMQYGDTWRKHRKLSKLALAPDIVQKYIPIQEHIARLYLRSLIKAPEDFIAQLRLTAGRIVIGTIYGLSVKDSEQEIITETEQALECVNRAMVPGTYLVDLIPALKHLPKRFPLASFLKEADDARSQVAGVVTRPFETVKRELASGTALPSFTADLLCGLEDSSHSETENTIKWASGSMYGAGAETSFAAILTFMLAMTLYPDKQATAQAELDRVVGPDRLPELNDQASLPYVSALIKETLRWHVVLPLSVARRSTHEDYYDGCVIPAGSLVLPNIWAIAYDEKRHHAPSEFVPERFLGADSDAPDPYAYSFGFGRRACPGKHLATNSLFIVISHILASFRISKKIDEYGNEVKVTAAFTKGLVSFPESFECNITPRSAKITDIIMTRTNSDDWNTHQ